MKRSIGKKLIVAGVVLAVLAIGAWVFVWSGVYPIGADEPHTAPVFALMTQVRNRSVAAGARDVKLRDLRDEKMIATGARNYSEMCVGCHLAPGVTKSELREGLYPQPPNLSQPSARDPREVFWIIKHGIKMSGMPAWGRTHDDEAIWAMVAFISSMPTMPVARYQQLAGTAASRHGMSHGEQAGSMPGMAHGEKAGSMPGMAHGEKAGSMPGMAQGEKAAHAHAGGPQREAANGQRPAAQPSRGSMAGMDHSQMKGMQKPEPGKGQPGAGQQSHGSMPGMDHSQMKGMQPDSGKGHGATSQQPHAAIPGMDHGGSMAGMDMGRMQGGRAPRDARDPHGYSNGLAHGPMRGMDMADDALFGYARFDKVELARVDGRSAVRVEAQGWYGGDHDKLWWKLDGGRAEGRTEATRTELLWARAIAPFWTSQLGLRHDFGEGPRRTWLAMGVQGIAPYWVDVDATAYVGENGRTAARLDLGYEILFTQRLILQPSLELNWHGKDDPARGIGRGFSDIEAGARLRFELRRQFAPYVGVLWKRKLGRTADFARATEGNSSDTEWVAGMRIWF